MARSNVLETAKRIRRQLTSSTRPEQLTLAQTVIAGATGVQFVEPLPASLRVGSTLGIDLELMRVTAVNTGAQTATVVRGYLDSEDAGHTAGALVDVNARFPMIDIVESMLTEIQSWGPQLYYVDDDTFPVGLTDITLQMPVEWTSMIGLVDVLQKDTDLDFTAWPRMKCKLIRGTPAGFDGATVSGQLIRFTEPVRTGNVYVRVAMPYTDFLTLDPALDLITDYFLTPGLLEVVELGTKKRLIMDGEYDRIARQPLETNRFGENTMLQSMTSMLQMIEAQYVRRKQSEVNKLRRTTPVRMT